MLQKNYTNVGLLALSMLAFSTGVQTLISGLDMKTALVELGVGILLLVIREVAKKFGEDL